MIFMGAESDLKFQWFLRLLIVSFNLKMLTTFLFHFIFQISNITVEIVNFTRVELEVLVANDFALIDHIMVSLQTQEGARTHLI